MSCTFTASFWSLWSLKLISPACMSWQNTSPCLLFTMRTKPDFYQIICLLGRLIKPTLSFVLFFSLFDILKYSASMLVFFEREASSHFKIICSFWLLIFLECLVFSKEKVRVNFDFIVKMKFMFLFNILCQSLLVILKVIIQKVLFSKGLAFNFLLIFENLVNRRCLGVRSLIKFVHKNIVILTNTILNRLIL